MIQGQELVEFGDSKCSAGFCTDKVAYKRVMAVDRMGARSRTCRIGCLLPSLKPTVSILSSSHLN